MRKLPALFTASALLVAGMSPARATLVHLYEFNGNLNDSIGSIALTSNGGTVGAGALAFGANEGPSFSGEASLAATYTIGLRFSFDARTGYRKVVDFKNLTSDTGHYILNNTDDFYPIGTGLGIGTSYVDLLITRNGSTNTYTSYVNGSQSLTFNDGGGLGIASLVSGSAVFHFLRDDSVTSGEASSGVVDEIRIWDHALTAGEATNAFSPYTPVSGVPDAGPGFAFGLALLSLGAWAHRRRR